MVDSLSVSGQFVDHEKMAPKEPSLPFGADFYWFYILLNDTD